MDVFVPEARQLRDEMVGLREEFRSEMARLGTEMLARFGSVEARLALQEERQAAVLDVVRDTRVSVQALLMRTDLADRVTRIELELDALRRKS